MNRAARPGVPPTDAEHARNDAIFDELQSNPNLSVDLPEPANAILGRERLIGVAPDSDPGGPPARTASWPGPKDPGPRPFPYAPPWRANGGNITRGGVGSAEMRHARRNRPRFPGG